MVNAAFTRVTGYRSNEVVGRLGSEVGLIHLPADRERFRSQVERDGVVIDLPTTIVTRSGQLVSMRISAAAFEMDGRNYVVINARDVTETERTRLEHAAILERASIGIAFTRHDHFVQANPRFERTFGWPVGTLRGEPGAAIWAGADGDDEIGRIAEPLLSQGQPFEIEREMRCRDGGVFWCRLLAQVVDPLHPVDGGTIWIADDVSERRRIDAALAAARDAAEAANRAKSAFLANTSHEIRTPLNGLLGLARIAMQSSVDDVARRRYLKQIFETAQGLEGILSDILDLSKIEAGKITVENVGFDLREMLAAVHRSYRSLAQVKGLSLRLWVEGDLPRKVSGDPIRTRQILGNFITNAVKFTDVGGVRIVAARAEAPGRVRLAVVDSGVGIDAQTRQHLWRPFSQGDSSTTRRYGGTGLGLSICRELAELMGGTVGLDSAPRRGSTFWAELPLGGLQDRGLQDGGADGAVDATPARALRRREPGPGGGTRASDALAEAAEPDFLHDRRVLLVEDNPVNMMIAAATLEHWGADVSQACDGRMAIHAVQAAASDGRPFDAVLMDVQMPVMSGYEAAIELRKDYDAVQLPIIALTAAALLAERDQALAAGMNDFLTKPIDAPKLKLALARHVRGGLH